MQVKCSKDTLLSREKNSQYSNYIPILIKLDTNLKGVTKYFGNLKCLWNCKNIVMSIIYFFLCLGLIYFLFALLYTEFQTYL